MEFRCAKQLGMASACPWSPRVLVLGVMYISTLKVADGMYHLLSLDPTRSSLPSVGVCLVICVFFDGLVAEKFVGDLKSAFSTVFASVFPLVSVCLVGFHIFPTSSFVFSLVEPLAILLP